MSSHGHPSGPESHAEHAWERARVAQLARHEEKVRRVERDRVARRVQALQGYDQSVEELARIQEFHDEFEARRAAAC